MRTCKRAISSALRPIVERLCHAPHVPLARRYTGALGAVLRLRLRRHVPRVFEGVSSDTCPAADGCGRTVLEEEVPRTSAMVDVAIDTGWGGRGPSVLRCDQLADRCSAPLGESGAELLGVKFLFERTPEVGYRRECFAARRVEVAGCSICRPEEARGASRVAGGMFDLGEQAQARGQRFW